MSQYARSAPMLMQLFQYAPIDIINDVINAVNSVGTKTVHSIQKFLAETNDKTDGRFTSELNAGTQRLEALMHRAIDDVFDRYEVYALRNLFVLDDDLRSDGWVRLLPSEGVDFSQACDLSRATSETEALVAQLCAEREKVRDYERAVEQVSLRIQEFEKVLADLPDLSQELINDMEELRLAEVKELPNVEVGVPLPLDLDLEFEEYKRRAQLLLALSEV